MTEIVAVSTAKIMRSTQQAVDEVVCALQRGDVVLHPTDTIYGVCADATNPLAVNKVRKIKNIQMDQKPFLVLVHSRKMLREHAVVTPLASAILQAVKSMPITLLLECKNDTLEAVRGPSNTVAIRVTSDMFCCAFIEKFGKPVISTSANISGEQYSEDVRTIVDIFREKVRLVVVRRGLHRITPTTIVDARGEKAVVFREGTVSKECLAKFL